MTRSLLWFIVLFYGALALGWTVRRWQAASPHIMRATILLIEAPIFIFTFWMLDGRQVWLSWPLPLLSALLILATLRLAPLVARRLLPAAASQGSFVLASAFSNIGTTGGAFLCYLLYGLPGLSLAYLYLLPYPILIFTLGFSAAQRFSRARPLAWRDYVHNLTTNAVAAIPLAAIGLGILLNVSGWRPAALVQPTVDVLIKLDLGIMCLAIGMTLRPTHLFRPWKPVAAVGLLKFVGLPILTLLGVLLIYGSLDPLAARVLLIQSAMPPAIYAVITANVFGLDRDLVNALWLSLTVGLIPVAALLFWLMPKGL